MKPSLVTLARGNPERTKAETLARTLTGLGVTYHATILERGMWSHTFRRGGRYATSIPATLGWRPVVVEERHMEPRDRKGYDA